MKRGILELYYRLRSQTPKFFRRFQKLCAVLAAAGGYFKQHDIDFQILGMSAVTLLIGAGVAGILGNQFAVDSPAGVKEQVDAHFHA